MTTAKRKALATAGWSVGDAADLLGLSDEERQLMEVRRALALAVRRQRPAGNAGSRFRVKLAPAAARAKSESNGFCG